MLARFRSNWTVTVLVCGAALALRADRASGQIQADGNLGPELSAILTDSNGNGIPDFAEWTDPSLQVRRRVGFWTQYVDPSGARLPREDGFAEEPTSAEVVPPFFPCVDRFLRETFATNALRTPINHGRVTVIYFADSNRQISGPGQDDSFLYVGMDICNGDPYQVSGNLPPFVYLVDYVLNPSPDPVGNACQYGLPAFNPITGGGYTHHQFLPIIPGNPPRRLPCPVDGSICWLMVPFDADGDGNPSVRRE